MTVKINYLTLATSFTIEDEAPHDAYPIPSRRPTLFRPIWMVVTRNSTDDGWEAEVTGTRVRLNSSDGTRTTIRFNSYMRNIEIPAYVTEAAAMTNPPTLPGGQT